MSSMHKLGGASTTTTPLSTLIYPTNDTYMHINPIHHTTREGAASAVCDTSSSSSSSAQCKGPLVGMYSQPMALLGSAAQVLTDVSEVTELFPFVCGICCLKFNRIQEFFYHFKVHDSRTFSERYFHACRQSTKIQNSPSVSEDSELYKCGICGLPFPSMCLLNDHLVNGEKVSKYSMHVKTKVAENLDYSPHYEVNQIHNETVFSSELILESRALNNKHDRFINELADKAAIEEQSAVCETSAFGNDGIRNNIEQGWAPRNSPVSKFKQTQQTACDTLQVPSCGYHLVCSDSNLSVVKVKSNKDDRQEEISIHNTHENTENCMSFTEIDTGSLDINKPSVQNIVTDAFSAQLDNQLLHGGSPVQTQSNVHTDPSLDSRDDLSTVSGTKVAGSAGLHLKSDAARPTCQYRSAYDTRRSRRAVEIDHQNQSFSHSAENNDGDTVTESLNKNQCSTFSEVSLAKEVNICDESSEFEEDWMRERKFDDPKRERRRLLMIRYQRKYRQRKKLKSLGKLNSNYFEGPGNKSENGTDGQRKRLNTNEGVLETKVPCDVCGLLFKKKNLKRHTETHSELKAYQCDICCKSFKTKGYLYGHKIHHRQERDLICDYCGKAFNNGPNLRQHLKIHVAPRTLQCPICPKRFCSNYVLKDHVMRHSDVKPHMCPKCGRTFKIQQEVTRHMLVHSDERPYVCGVCQKGFKCRSNLVKHEKIHSK